MTPEGYTSEGYIGAKGHDCQLCAVCSERHARLVRRRLLATLAERLQKLDGHAYNVHADYFAGYETAMVNISHLLATMVIEDRDNE